MSPCLPVVSKTPKPRWRPPSLPAGHGWGGLEVKVRRCPSETTQEACVCSLFLPAGPSCESPRGAAAAGAPLRASVPSWGEACNSQAPAARQEGPSGEPGLISLGMGWRCRNEGWSLCVFPLVPKRGEAASPLVAAPRLCFPPMDWLCPTPHAGCWCQRPGVNLALPRAL